MTEPHVYEVTIGNLTQDLEAIFKMLPLDVLQELVKQRFQSSTTWHYCVRELESRYDG